VEHSTQPHSVAVPILDTQNLPDVDPDAITQTLTHRGASDSITTFSIPPTPLTHADLEQGSYHRQASRPLSISQTSQPTVALSKPQVCACGYECNKGLRACGYECNRGMRACGHGCNRGMRACCCECNRGMRACGHDCNRGMRAQSKQYVHCTCNLCPCKPKAMLVHSIPSSHFNITGACFHSLSVKQSQRVH